MSPPLDKTDLGDQSDEVTKESKQGSNQVRSIRGYVIEHHISGVWKKSVAAILVYDDYETANHFRKNGLMDPEEWSVVSVVITRKDPER